jgi:hypothetical protein
MHWLHALWALDICPSLLKFDLCVDLETVEAEEVRAVAQKGEKVQGVSRQAERTLAHLK